MIKYLRLTRGKPGYHDGNGLEALRLGLWKGFPATEDAIQRAKTRLTEVEKEVAHLNVYSGAPGHQVFRTFADQQPGRLEPIPQGVYDHLGSLEWADRPGVFDGARFPSINSPIWVTILESRAIGFHLDGNISYAPGTAGCVGLHNIPDCETFATWWEGQAPTELRVEWGL